VSPRTVRAAIDASLPLLQRADTVFLERAGCISCHNNSLFQMTAAALRPKGFRIDETAVSGQMARTRAYLASWRERELQDIAIPGQIDTTSYILAGLVDASYTPDAATDALARYVKRRQYADGSWRIASHRPPIESGSITTTAVAIRSLRSYAPAPLEAEYARAVRRGVSWLAAATPKNTEDHAFMLLGLSWAGDADASAIRKTAGALIAQQRQDGGWNQIPTLASDAYATGQALVALATSGALTPDDEAYRKGVRFLLDTQLEDGSWYVRSRAIPIQPYFDSEFPHGPDQFISAAATNWATMALAAAAPQAAASPGGVEVLAVRDNVFMIAGAGGNVAVQVGDDGVVVVDAGSAARAPDIVAAIRRITPKPIRYIINTGPDADHVGGNETLSQAGQTLFGPARLGGQRQEFMGPVAAIMATEGVLRRMTAPSGATPAYPAGAWPTESFHYPRKYMYLNGEAIEVLHQPAAHTDGDAFVFFRRSDVVVAGDVLDTRQFPVIDVDRGGSIEGVVAALNRLSEMAIASVPIVAREAGTVVIPGHGRLYDQYDVIEYRDMVTVIRDRVRDLVAGGRSLAQVKDAHPARGYTGRYGNAGGAWTTDHFVEAVYRSLAKDRK
jgi:glyoxylase-like metal-dependent hydrolase (beta-lactamase superfamily II)